MSNSDKSKGIPGMAFIASLENFLNMSVLEKNFAMLISIVSARIFPQPFCGKYGNYSQAPSLTESEHQIFKVLIKHFQAIIRLYLRIIFLKELNYIKLLA